MPHIKLGGVELTLHSGAPSESEDPIGGDSVVRMSDGTGVPMSHWSKMSGSISGTGFAPPGLSGLDFRQPQELRTTQVSNISGDGPEFELTSTPRDDVAPWAFAKVGKELVEVACSYDAGVATVDEVPGAEFYQVWWYPVYTVKARLSKAQTSAAPVEHSWSIAWEEL